MTHASGMGARGGFTADPRPEIHAVAGGHDRFGDNVARFEELREEYPEACYTFGPPFFYGALRDEDDVVRATDLGRLVDSLLAREQHPETP